MIEIGFDDRLDAVFIWFNAIWMQSNHIKYKIHLWNNLHLLASLLFLQLTPSLQETLSSPPSELSSRKKLHSCMWLTLRTARPSSCSQHSLELHGLAVAFLSCQESKKPFKAVMFLVWKEQSLTPAITALSGLIMLKSSHLMFSESALLLSQMVSSCQDTRMAVFTSFQWTILISQRQLEP